MIATTLYMFNDIKVFLYIWVTVLVMFTCSGILLFQGIDELQHIKEGFLFWISAGLGDWDLSIFDHYRDNFDPPREFHRYVGIYTLLTFVFINVVVLINVVIAMMTDTYRVMTDLRKGVYNYNIIRAAPAYKLDKYYGGLILTTNPFCILSFMLLPFYWFIKNKETLHSLNSRFYLVNYTLVAMPLGVIFFVVNLAMMPFAYLKTCVHKVNLARMGVIGVGSCFGYITTGLFMLLFAQFTDLWA